jgi:hypothetical protein
MRDSDVTGTQRIPSSRPTACDMASTDAAAELDRVSDRFAARGEVGERDRGFAIGERDGAASLGLQQGSRKRLHHGLVLREAGRARERRAQAHARIEDGRIDASPP